MEAMPVEAIAKGTSELLALGAEIDADLQGFIDKQADWAKDMRDRHSLSDEALAILLNTAPSVASCVADRIARTGKL
jgi:hypothetical protein